MIWLVLIGMMLATAALAVAPLLRASRDVAPASDAMVAFHRRQLAELEADETRGVIGPDEATAARREIERRLLRAADTHGAAVGAARPPLLALQTVAGALLVLIVGATAVYGALGRPGLSGQAHRADEAAAQPVADGGPTLGQALDQLGAHLAEHPDDLEGWWLYGRTLTGVGRHSAAANAFGRAARLDPHDAELRIAQGEALMRVNDGQVTLPVRVAFAWAATLAPEHPALQYYRGLALLQEEKPDEARAVWAGLAERATGAEPWAAGLTAQLGALDRQLAARDRPAVAPPLDRETAADIAALPADEQRAMVEAMVDRLAARLEETPEDVDGWRRLARAQAVLGRPERARVAFRRALDVASADQAAVIQREMDALATN